MAIFGSGDRYLYAASPLIEVICQLRFPAILTIGAQEPVAFQEAIRGDYPRYAVHQDQPPANAGNGAKPVTNYHFISQDGKWKVNLTSGFIALSTRGYVQWEDFAGRLDKVLAQFIAAYKPAFFERIGLRYVNAVSRRRLDLESREWYELIQPAYLGFMAEPDVEESALTRSTLDVDMKLEEECHLKVHAGLGLLGDGKQDPETKFILDFDLSCGGSIPMNEVPGKLETLHDHADRLFRGAITSELHKAMDGTAI